MNHQDDASFERVVNTPARGIGEKTMMQIRETASKETVSLWEAMHLLLLQAPKDENEKNELSARARQSLNHFSTLIQNLENEVLSLPLSLLIEKVLDETGLINHYANLKDENGFLNLIQ